MESFASCFRAVITFWKLHVFGFAELRTEKVVEIKKKTCILKYALVCVCACICYHGALECGFVFDDISAIRENRDLRPTSPWSNLLHNDFWGTPMNKEQSHKSYRPVCVFTYRLNYLLHGLQPFGYHVVNVGLHALVCLLYKRTCALFVTERTAFVASLLFVVHPIHTEAVTGVVGRAEILSSFFYLLAFLSYVSAASKRTTDWFLFSCCLLLTALATFSKEQGITVVGICCVYDMFLLNKLRIQDFHLRSLILFGKGHLKEAGRRMGVLTSWALLLLAVRLKVMGVQLPVFTKFDNPAAAADSPARQLTFNYLVALNGWLLLCPHSLCCDWTMGSVPLVHSVADTRNLCTLGVYAALGAIVWNSLWVDDGRSRVLLMGVSLCVFPFLPASNLFFPVGFVVAERVLYTPSMGFCLLVAQGTHLLATRRPGLVRGSVVVLICIHAAKTVRRNVDWQSEYSLFLSGIRVNQKNAKLYNNVGHCLETQGKYVEALSYFHEAIRVEPNDIGAYINVGRTHSQLSMYEEAETAFRKARDLLPKPPFGEGHEARVAPSHLNVFLNLANLISRDGTRLEEADKLYQEAIRMRSDYVEAYINRGDILIRLNRTQEAQSVYEKALKLDHDNADIHYNLGVVFLEQRKADLALTSFDKALKINPRHEQALLNSAILMQEAGGAHKRKTAYHRLQMLLEGRDVSERVYFHLGMLAMDEKNTTVAEKYFRKAVEMRSDFRSALFNLALLLSEAKRPKDALPFLQQLREHHPDHVKGLILLGDIYINSVKDLDSAQECYESILHYEPHNVQALHNLCVVHVERGLMAEAETCLEKASALAPREHYVARHLDIVRNRRLHTHKMAAERKTEEKIATERNMDAKMAAQRKMDIKMAAEQNMDNKMSVERQTDDKMAAIRNMDSKMAAERKVGIKIAPEQKIDKMAATRNKMAAERKTDDKMAAIRNMDAKVAAERKTDDKMAAVRNMDSKMAAERKIDIKIAAEQKVDKMAAERKTDAKMAAVRNIDANIAAVRNMDANIAYVRNMDAKMAAERKMVAEQKMDDKMAVKRNKIGAERNTDVKMDAERVSNSRISDEAPNMST